MRPGETVATGANKFCDDCNKPIKGPQIMESVAGYYIGYECDCGPYSRETDYCMSRPAAEKALHAIANNTPMADYYRRG